MRSKTVPEASKPQLRVRPRAGLMVLLLVLWSSVGHMAVSRTKYLGEGSCACALGLLSGLLLLILRRATNIDQEALRQLLTFNPADFFT